MIKSVMHLKNGKGYIVNHETKTKRFSWSYCENKVPYRVVQWILQENVKAYETDYIVMYKEV